MASEAESGGEGALGVGGAALSAELLGGACGVEGWGVARAGAGEAAGAAGLTFSISRSKTRTAFAGIWWLGTPAGP